MGKDEAALKIVSLTPFINITDSSRDLTIFMVSFISSFEIINVVVRKVKSKERPDPNIFLWIATSFAEATIVNTNGIKHF